MFVGVGASPRARPVRAGQAQRAVHHLHRRDRRRRPPSRRRARRRARRARADAEPAAGRDGRLRLERGRHHDRGHQPARRARPGAAAARAASTARSWWTGPTCAGARASSRCTRARSRSPTTSTSTQIARGTPGMAGADLANLVNEAALLAARRNRKKVTMRGLRGRQGQGHARHGAQEPGHDRGGAPQHRLPRGGPRARGLAAAGLGSGRQDHDHPARPRARASPRYLPHGGALHALEGGPAAHALP